VSTSTCAVVCRPGRAAARQGALRRRRRSPRPGRRRSSAGVAGTGDRPPRPAPRRRAGRRRAPRKGAAYTASASTVRPSCSVARWQRSKSARTASASGFARPSFTASMSAKTPRRDRRPRRGPRRPPPAGRGPPPSSVRMPRASGCSREGSAPAAVTPSAPRASAGTPGAGRRRRLFTSRSHWRAESARPIASPARRSPLRRPSRGSIAARRNSIGKTSSDPAMYPVSMTSGGASPACRWRFRAGPIASSTGEVISRRHEQRVERRSPCTQSGSRRCEDVQRVQVAARRPARGHRERPPAFARTAGESRSSRSVTFASLLCRGRGGPPSRLDYTRIAMPRSDERAGPAGSRRRWPSLPPLPRRTRSSTRRGAGSARRPRTSSRLPRGVRQGRRGARRSQRRSRASRAACRLAAARRAPA